MLYSTGFGPVTVFNGSQDFANRYQAAFKAAPQRGGAAWTPPSFVKRAGIDASGVLYSTGFGPVTVFNGSQDFANRYQAAFKAAP
ncbi:branched chain amino acid ABC transporter substrate-binding protein, partial [Methylobacterium radiotolerans]